MKEHYCLGADLGKIVDVKHDGYSEDRDVQSLLAEARKLQHAKWSKCEHETGHDLEARYKNHFVSYYECKLCGVRIHRKRSNKPGTCCVLCGWPMQFDGILEQCTQFLVFKCTNSDCKYPRI